MKVFMMSAMVAAAALMGASPVGAVTFDLSPTAFSGGGSLSGSISLNDSETMITGYDLTTTAGTLSLFDVSGFPSVATAGANYLPTNSIAIPFLSNLTFLGTSSTLSLDGVKLAGDLISFQSATEGAFIFGRSTGAGAFSAEASPPTTVSAAPEPGTWMMMILGFGLVGGVLRSAYRRSEERFTRKVRSLATA